MILHGPYVNGTIACALAAETQSHLISLTGQAKGSDRVLAVVGVARGDGDMPVAVFVYSAGMW